MQDFFLADPLDERACDATWQAAMRSDMAALWYDPLRDASHTLPGRWDEHRAVIEKDRATPFDVPEYELIVLCPERGTVSHILRVISKDWSSFYTAEHEGYEVSLYVYEDTHRAGRSPLERRDRERYAYMSGQSSVLSLYRAVIHLSCCEPAPDGNGSLSFFLRTVPYKLSLYLHVSTLNGVAQPLLGIDFTKPLADVVMALSVADSLRLSWAQEEDRERQENPVYDQPSYGPQRVLGAD